MNNVVRALSVSLILVLSSLAGCLTDDTEDENIEIESYGTVMVSTYHVGELVSAVAGDQVTIEYMSLDNIPVHDYEPSASDLIRLQQADLFFYHGLNLEPWVESTLSSLGDDAPPSYMTHAMPTGQTTLDYESMLVSDVCEYMSEGPYEATTLVTEDGTLPEIHAENLAHSLSFPEEMDDDHDDHDDHSDDEDDHDDHSDEEDDHDDHSDEEDDHDDHSDEEDGHDDHAHAEAEKIIENAEACPANTIISVFHMEEGEHTLEFVSEDGTPFDMVALKMGGGHAHHDHHGHGDHDDHGDDHDDHGEMCHNSETHENYEATEEECEAAGHMWMEDDDHDEHDDHDGSVCHNTDTHENYESNEADCEAAGHVWMEDDHDDHDDHLAIEGDWSDEWGSNHSISESSWVSGDSSYSISQFDNDDQYIIAQNGVDNAWNPSFWSKFDWTTFSGEMYYCQSAYDAASEADAMNATSDSTDPANSGCGGFSWTLMHHVDDGHDDHDDHDDHDQHDGHVGYATIHIEAEGDYGFALPMNVGFYILMDDGGHDDHDDHSDEEDDHDDHSDDEDGHDDHSDDEDGHDDQDGEIAADDEDAFNYDPHSWLSPLAFEAQVNVVLEKMSMTFPDGTSAFTANAEAYNMQLDALDDSFNAAFGVDGTCAAAGQAKTIVANHNAYSYMSVQYDIEIITLHGLDPEGEPSPQDIAKVVEHINEEGITVLFVEEYTDQTAVASIVQETGVTIEILYTMEMSPSDTNDDYMSMMNKNLDNMVEGIGC